MERTEEEKEINRQEWREELDVKNEKGEENGADVAKVLKLPSKRSGDWVNDKQSSAVYRLLNLFLYFFP